MLLLPRDAQIKTLLMLHTFFFLRFRFLPPAADMLTPRRYGTPNIIHHY